jgi:carboxynorspermidine decarboxylase
MSLQDILRHDTDCATGRSLSTMAGLETPAFVYYEQGIQDSCLKLRNAADAAGFEPLFAIKSFSLIDAISSMVPPLVGFATSSLFESRLARQAIGQQATGSVHITSPGLKLNEVEQLAMLCDYVSFNSLSQAERLVPAFVDQRNAACGNHCELGLRVNPQLSFIKDARYDPCRQHSKLGVPLARLVDVLQTAPHRLAPLTGLHIHSNCDSENPDEVRQTIAQLESRLSPWLGGFSWLNLGGGYDFSELDSEAQAAIRRLGEDYGLRVFVEPGASVVRSHGYIVASVLDLFESDGKQVALLDTSVNHMPEVFEYQYEPDVVGDSDTAEHEYILAGCTCLAGDTFGLYGFDQPLEIGSQVVFTDMGAYTLVKSHVFNGVGLPNIYALTSAGELVIKRSYSYEDFVRVSGGINHVTA